MSNRQQQRRPWVALTCLTALALLERARHAPVQCQGHFKPLLHPFGAQPRELPSRTIYAPRLIGAHQGHNQQQQQQHANRGASLMASLTSGRNPQSQLNQMMQHYRIQHQQQRQHVPVSDRRASSSSSGAVNQLLPASQQAVQQQLALSAKQLKLQAEAQQSQQQLPDGKLLICYYTTKQTAPYWPKDGREFVVPADRLNQVVNSFASSGPKMSQQEQQQQSSGSFSPQVSEQSAMPFAAHAAQNNLPARGQDAQTNSNKQHNQRRQQQQNSFATNGRLVVVAPKFVPFNRTLIDEPTLAADSAATRPSAASFAQMFFMPSNNAAGDHQRHNTIASRQDNVASLATTTSAANQPPPLRQLSHQQPPASSVVPDIGHLIVSNNDNSPAAGGPIVFDKTLKQAEHDLRRNTVAADEAGGGGGGGLLTIVHDEAKTNSGPQQAAAMQPGAVGPPLLLLASQNNGATHGQTPPTASVNNRDHQAERSAQMRHQQQQQQQLMYSAPAMSRAFVVGTSVGAPLVTSGGNLVDNQDQLLGQTVPLVNADNSDYYYYYNQPSVSTGGGTGSSAPRAGGSPSATTISLATTPYRSMQHATSGLQKGKSLQVVESELSLAQSASPLPPITFVRSPSSGLLPSYSVVAGGGGGGGGGSQGHQSQPLDRLIVSNGPAPTVADVRQPHQHYSGPTIGSSSLAPASQVHLPRFTPPGDLLKPSSEDDGLISSGTKTTPIASIASPSSSSSSSSPTAASSQQQLVATLPSGLLISYPSAASSAVTSITPPAQSPNGSSTAATASVPLSTSAQMSSGMNANADSDSSANDGNNRNNNNHHHHHQPNNNNRQIVGVGGNSLSATLVSSPLSTMFDVFGAASQYLMRFKPSSLISPSSFASLNNIVGDSSSGHHHPNARSNSTSPLASLPFASSILGAAGHKSNHSSHGGLLSRLTLQTHQRREDICGRTIQTPERRIIGGEGAKYGEFPYQVHIKIAKHQCGGALIDKQSIVTAAHCVYHFITRAPVSKLQIVIGAYDIEDEQYQELPPQYFKVNRVKLHPNFRFSASHPDRYDIAILKLDKPVKYADNVLPVCLPGKDLKYENMVGTVTGFGKTDPSLSNRYGTRLLQKVDVPIIENGECERWHRTRGIDLKIFPEMMCAGYEDGLKDACVGDSGGPLVVKTPVGSNGSFRWTLAGITSAGFGCAQSRQPGIYHRVSHTVDWILDNLD